MKSTDGKRESRKAISYIQYGFGGRASVSGTVLGLLSQGCETLSLFLGGTVSVGLLATLSPPSTWQSQLLARKTLMSFENTLGPWLTQRSRLR